MAEKEIEYLMVAVQNKQDQFNEMSHFVQKKHKTKECSKLIQKEYKNKHDSLFVCWGFMAYQHS